jgi:hypothetical protein
VFLSLGCWFGWGVGCAGGAAAGLEGSAVGVGLRVPVGWRPWGLGWEVLWFSGLGWSFAGFGSSGLLGLMGWDEPESLILAQSERWRHA